MKEEILKRMWNYLNNYKTLRYDDAQNLQYDVDKKYLQENFEIDKDIQEILDFVPDEWEENLDTRRTKVKHSVPMKWLSKDFSKDSIVKFIKKTIWTEWQFHLWYKYDWTACTIRYDMDWKLIKAITRWNWIEWDDITENVKMVNWVREKIDLFKNKIFCNSIVDSWFVDYIEIRWEVLCEKEVFKRLWEVYSIKNTRQYSSGSLKRKNPEEVKAREIMFMPYQLLYIRKWKVVEPVNILQSDLHWVFNDLWFKFKSSDYLNISYNLNEIDKLKKDLEAFYESRNDLWIDIDWLVVKDNSIANQAIAINEWNDFAMAYKFPNEDYIVTVESIDYQMWKTWRLTPVINYTPIDILWVTCSRATWHNSESLEEMQIKVWDKISIVRSWDVIPYIVEVLESSNNEFTLPTNCPTCGTKLIREWAFQMCKNKTCAEKTEWAIYTVINNAWINFLWWTKIDEMIIRWILKSPYDIFRIKKEDFENISRTWHRSIDKIMDSIEKAKSNLTLDTIISWFNILWLWMTNWEKVMDAYREVENW